MAQHISIKFQNNVASQGLSLRSLGLDIKTLEQRQKRMANWKANHIGLKFQGATSLYDVGLGIVKMERW